AGTEERGQDRPFARGRLGLADPFGDSHRAATRSLRKEGSVGVAAPRASLARPSIWVSSLRIADAAKCSVLDNLKWTRPNPVAWRGGIGGSVSTPRRSASSPISPRPRPRSLRRLAR